MKERKFLDEWVRGSGTLSKKNQLYGREAESRHTLGVTGTGGRMRLNSLVETDRTEGRAKGAARASAKRKVQKVTNTMILS